MSLFLFKNSSSTFANTSTIRTQIANTTTTSNATNGNTSSGTGASFTIVLGSETYYQSTVIVPGLDANGSPTTNASITLPPTSIGSNTNYDLIVTTTTNPLYDDTST